MFLWGKAILTFANVSCGAETTARFKEIVIDTCDNDTLTAILWNPVILTQSARFTINESNGLPGYNQETKEKPKLVELASNTGNDGLQIGQSIQIQFDTILGDGSDMKDLTYAFGDGLDTSAFSLGFHAISASTVNFQSLTGINLEAIHAPEPSVLLFMAGGVPALITLKRK